MLYLTFVFNLKKYNNGNGIQEKKYLYKYRTHVAVGTWNISESMVQYMHLVTIANFDLTLKKNHLMFSNS